jgi:hypothetical protein
MIQIVKLKRTGTSDSSLTTCSQKFNLIVVDTIDHGGGTCGPHWFSSTDRGFVRAIDDALSYSPHDRLPEGWTELELLPGLTTENILAMGITWEDFRLFCLDKLVWMTPGVYVCFQYDEGDPVILSLGGDGGGIQSTDLRVLATRGTATAVVMTTCDFLVRLLATSEPCDVYIRGSHNEVPPPMSGQTLSVFFQESRSCLRKVFLSRMSLTEDQCRALATMSRLDVELDMFNCSLADDAAGAFIGCLRSENGPIELDRCQIDSQILASALTGTSRVTTLHLQLLYRNGDIYHGRVFRALTNNRGLLDLVLQHSSISNENWSVLCECLQAHPTLTSLDLRDTRQARPLFGNKIELSDEEKAHRTRAIAEMMQNNTALNSIDLSADERDQQIYTDWILPRLEMNIYTPRVLAIMKTDIALRRPLLGLALQTESVRNKSNLMDAPVWEFGYCVAIK